MGWGKLLIEFAAAENLFSGEKMQALEVVAQTVRVFNFKKVICKGRAIGLSNH